MFKIKLEQNTRFLLGGLNDIENDSTKEFIFNLENVFKLIFFEIYEKVELFCLTCKKDGQLLANHSFTNSNLR